MNDPSCRFSLFYNQQRLKKNQCKKNHNRFEDRVANFFNVKMTGHTPSPARVAKAWDRELRAIYMSQTANPTTRMPANKRDTLRLLVHASFQMWYINTTRKKNFSLSEFENVRFMRTERSVRIRQAMLACIQYIVHITYTIKFQT